MDGDRQLQETLKWLAGPVERSGVWANVEARAGGVGDNRGTPARAKRHVLRTLVFATLAVGLVAAIAIGSVATIRHYGQPNFVLRITDDDIMGAAIQPTPPGARSGHWQRLLTNDGGTIKALFIDPKHPSVLYAERPSVCSSRVTARRAGTKVRTSQRWRIA